MAKIIIILTIQRSGSTALMQHLRGRKLPNTLVFEELFLKYSVSKTLNQYPELQDLLPSKRFCEQDEDVREYLYNISLGENVIVFKLMLDQITPEIVLFLEETPDVKLIFFNRNVIDCARSSARVKLKINDAHKINNKGIIEKQVRRNGSFVSLFSGWYIVKQLYFLQKYKKIINKSLHIDYPDFELVHNSIKKMLKL